MQVLAVEDIGHLAAHLPRGADLPGKTFEIASDSVTGRQLEALFSAAAGRPIPYSRQFPMRCWPPALLHKLTGLVDDGRLAGHADLDAMRHCARRTARLRRLAVRPWPSRLRAGADHGPNLTTNR